MSTESVETRAVRAYNSYHRENGRRPTQLIMSPRSYTTLCREMESLRGYVGVSSVNRLLDCEVFIEYNCPDGEIWAHASPEPLTDNRSPFDHLTDALAYAAVRAMDSFGVPSDGAPRAKDPLKDPAFLAEVRRIENLPRPGVEKTLPWYGDDQIAAAASSEEQHGTSP